MNKFLKNKEVINASWLISGKVIQMILSLVIGIITARYLGPSNYGLISYGSAWVAFFSALSNLGINSVIVKELIDYPKEQGKAMGSALVLRLISSILSAIMIIGLVCIIDHDENTTIIVVALCSVGTIFNTFELINYWFQSQYKSKITAITTLIAYVAMSIYKVFLLIMGKGVEWFAFATSIDYIVVAVLLLYAYKKHNGQRFQFSFEKAKRILNNSYHYILSSMMIAIYGQTDKLMLKQMLNESEVAYYSTAVAICGMWVFVLSAIIDSVYPTIISLHGKDTFAFEKKNRQLYSIVFYVSTFVSIMIVLLGDWAVVLLYGKAYAPAAIPLKIVTWYTAFSYLGVARNAWIVSEGKQRYLKYMYFGAAILNVLLNYMFIPWLGAAGAAIASLTTQIFTSLILPMCFKEMRPNAKLMIEGIMLRKL